MSRNKVVISNHTLTKNRVMLILFSVLAVSGVYLAYEIGLGRAGFNRSEATAGRVDLESRNQELKLEVKTLRERAAVLETAAKIDREAYRKVEDVLVDLQSKVYEQQEDIEFYKGIFNENDGTGLRIQDFQVVQGLGEQEYDLRLVLAQAFRVDKQVSGSVEIVVEGLQHGDPVRFGLDELRSTDSAAAERLKYSFRYFQDIKAGLVLPADFVPERVHVIVRPQGKKSKTVEDFFVWNIKSS
jgi:cell division protein FtsB